MGRRTGGRIAYPAVLGALSLALLYVACVTPTGSWALTAAAGLGPCAAVISAGMPAGFLCWAGVSLLAMLLLPDKFCALLFAALFGLYPMVKSLAERLRRGGEWLLKLFFFNGAFTLIFFLMKTLVLESLPALLTGYGVLVLYLAANVVFCIYDIGLTKLISFYITRIHRAVRKGGRP